MPRKNVDGSNFMTWKGEKIESEIGVDSYSRCIFNEFELTIGDYVHISNPDKPLNVNQYYIVKIIQLYEIVDPLSLDFKYQAVVEAYRRPSDLPDEITKLVPDLDFNREVILDPVEDPYHIPLNSVRGKCNVMICEPSKTIPDTSTKIKNKQHVYICRYKIVNTNGKLSLVAVSYQQRRTPTVSPIKIVNKNSVHKVSKSQHETENIFAGSDSEIDESPVKVLKSSNSHNSSGARRNLNASLSDAGDNVLMGSIVDSPHRKKDDMKLTIKLIRENQTKRSENSGLVTTPLKSIQYNNDELDNLPKRQSAIKRQNRHDSPISHTPKTQKRSSNQYGTTNQENTPKSILKSCSIRLFRMIDSPRRNISFNLKEKRSPIQENTATQSEQKELNASLLPSSTAPSSLRRSKRRSSIYQVSLAESPLDTSFISDEDSLQETPQKSQKTPSKTPRRSSNKVATPSRTPKTTPKTRVSRNFSRRTLDLSIDDYYDSSPNDTLDETLNEILETPPKKSRKTPSKTPKKTPSKTPTRTPKRTSSTRISALEAVISERKTPIRKDRSDVQLAKESLHVSAVPKTLPCRENEFKDIYKFIESKILDETGGCMYVSGVPGTGKTATVTEVIRLLQLQAKRKKLPAFEFVEINGMRLTEPRQAYVHIYQQLTNVKVSWEQAHSLLEKRFTTPTLHRKTTVLLVDELDILCNRRQDVIYNLLDWPTKKSAKLVVVTIANTMDLPERLLMGRVTSRLGLTRLTFQPYSHKQLQEVVLARLTGTNIFENDAVQLVARKVASISGDCRRALDICRRATEIGEAHCNGKKVMVSMLHVQKAFNEMITNPKVLAIKGCSKYEKLFLQAVEAEVARTGVDETVLFQVYRQLESICALNGVPIPDPGIALRVSSRLGSSRLLICEHSSASIHQKIMLNVTQDDIYYALHVNNNE